MWILYKEFDHLWKLKATEILEQITVDTEDNYGSGMAVMHSDGLYNLYIMTMYGYFWNVFLIKY